jgi:hypothetical protein
MSDTEAGTTESVVHIPLDDQNKLHNGNEKTELNSTCIDSVQEEQSMGAYTLTELVSQEGQAEKDSRQSSKVEPQTTNKSSAPDVDNRPNKKRKVGNDSQNKFDPSILAESNNPNEIRKQVSYTCSFSSF